jgi:hypothetical protein
MDAKQKSIELIYKFYDIHADSPEYGLTLDMAKQCARIAVDEIIKSNPCCEDSDRGGNFQWSDNTYYWNEVLKKLI